MIVTEMEHGNSRSGDCEGTDMKITMYIIKDFLGKDVLSGQIHTGRSAGIVESVAVFDPELDTSPEYAYLVERRHASLFAGREYQGAFLFLGGKHAI